MTGAIGQKQAADFPYSPTAQKALDTALALAGNKSAVLDRAVTGAVQDNVGSDAAEQRIVSIVRDVTEHVKSAPVPTVFFAATGTQIYGADKKFLGPAATLRDASGALVGYHGAGAPHTTRTKEEDAFRATLSPAQRTEIDRLTEGQKYFLRQSKDGSVVLELIKGAKPLGSPAAKDVPSLAGTTRAVLIGKDGSSTPPVEVPFVRALARGGAVDAPGATPAADGSIPVGYTTAYGLSDTEQIVRYLKARVPAQAPASSPRPAVSVRAAFAPPSAAGVSVGRA
jgi:hypothetical protein